MHHPKRDFWLLILLSLSFLALFLSFYIEFSGNETSAVLAFVVVLTGYWVYKQVAAGKKIKKHHKLKERY